MPRPCILFSARQFPSVNDAFDYAPEAPESVGLSGLAEWFDHIPDLFLLLLGEQSAAAPWRAYADPCDNQCLVTPMPEARARWRALTALAHHHHPELAASLAQVQAVLEKAPFAWLVLDIWDSQPPAKQGKKAWPRFVKGLQARAATLTDALHASSPQHLAPELAHLLAHWSRECGWWSPAVAARAWLLDDPFEEVAARVPTLAGLQALRWLDAIPAWVVQRQGAREFADPIGIVTPYGRWLLPLHEGMTRVETGPDECSLHWGWLACQQDVPPPPATSTPEYPPLRLNARVWDVNGLPVTPLLPDTLLDICAPHVLYTQPCTGSAADEAALNPGQLRRLPDLSPLLENISNVNYSDDGLVHFQRRVPNPAQPDNPHTFEGLMDDGGQVLVSADRYRSISPFHKTKRIATVCKQAPPTSESDESCLFGILDIRGQEVLPCQYRAIHPLRPADKPPKVLGKDRLLAQAQDGCIHIFTITGQLVCATPYVPTQLFFAEPLIDGAMYLTDDQWVYQVSLDGDVLARDMPLDQLNQEIRQARRQQFGLDAPHRHVTAADVVAEAPWNTLAELSAIFCLGDAHRAARVAQHVRQQLEPAGGSSGEEDENENDEAAAIACLRADQPAAAALLHLMRWALLEEDLAAIIDWKDTDALENLAASLTIPELQGFDWLASDNSGSVSDGIAAARAYLRPRGLCLVQLPTQGDCHDLAVARADDLPRLLHIAQSLGETLQT
ncbi:MAG: hypothetical protein Q4G70_08230 [Pseudomonadota bacterium]|nr:hypothetical protein [Pseudomonadota bacterium]